MAVNAIPESIPSLSPILVLHNAASAIEFYKEAFGGVEQARVTGADGRLEHGEVRIGRALILLADREPGNDDSLSSNKGDAPAPSVRFYLYLKDVDAAVDRAVAVGARLLSPPTNQYYGDRTARVEDPFGYIWTLATHIEDLTEEEMARRYSGYNSAM